MILNEHHGYHHTNRVFISRNLISKSHKIINPAISSFDQSISKKSKSKFSLYQTEILDSGKNLIYQESLSKKILKMMKNPLNFLVLAYIVGFIIMKTLNFYGFMKNLVNPKTSSDLTSFSKENLPKISDDGSEIFECEKCGAQLRPAKGRAQIVLSKPNFRCPRCRSKSSSFFNINDMSDPRAIARIKKIEKEQSEDYED